MSSTHSVSLASYNSHPTAHNKNNCIVPPTPLPRQQNIETEETNVDPVVLLELYDLTGESDSDISAATVDYDMIMLEL